MANQAQLAILKQGVGVWNKWREENPEEPIDLSGADLLEADLSKAELNGADLRGAELNGARLRQANLRQAWLTGARLRDAHLSGADLTGADLPIADLSGADLTGANLSGAFLVSANLTDADLKMANLDGAAVLGVAYSHEAMRGRYMGIRAGNCYGDAIFRRDAQDQDYIDTLGTRCRKGWPRILFNLWARTDYGRSIPSVGLFALNVALVFGIIYMFFPSFICYGSHVKTPFTPFYFSIVTYTTLGFGDITARGLAGEILVALEVVLGYITLGLLLAILANTVARRS